jgi:predicted  nucleic acid-binding Zn-ribbon protein
VSTTRHCDVLQDALHALVTYQQQVQDREQHLQDQIKQLQQQVQDLVGNLKQLELEHSGCAAFR